MNLKFGTDGIRGPVETKVTPEACLRIGHAAGIVFKELGWDTVLIGKDTRVSGYMLEAALQAGFLSVGMNVRLLGPLPTPGVAYLTKSFRNQCGIVISASHNDYQDNGIKIFDNSGVKIDRKIEMMIENILSEKITSLPSVEIGKAKRFDESGPRYVEFCKSTVPDEISFSDLRIVLDCANGASYKVSPDVFRELGAETIVVGDQPDGFNINQDCGSTNPELVQKLVKERRADFGVSLDGDADRVTIVDRESNILDGDDILYILGFANPNRLGPWSGIVGTQMSNVGLEDGLNKLGYSFKRAEVGDKYVSDLLSKEGWLLGGEPSGHIICRDLVSTGDGTIAALKTISSLVMLEKDPKDVLSNSNKIPQINESISVINKDIVSDSEVKTAINDIKSDLTINRILVRPSGTENKIRIMIESENKKTAKKYTNDLIKLFESKTA